MAKKNNNIIVIEEPVQEQTEIKPVVGLIDILNERVGINRFMRTAIINLYGHLPDQTKEEWYKLLKW